MDCNEVSLNSLLHHAAFKKQHARVAYSYLSSSKYSLRRGLFIFCCIFFCSNAIAKHSNTSVSVYYGRSYPFKVDYDKHVPAEDRDLPAVRPGSSDTLSLGIDYYLSKSLSIGVSYVSFCNFSYNNTSEEELYSPDLTVTYKNYPHQKIKAKAFFADFTLRTEKFHNFFIHSNIGLGLSKNIAGDMKFIETANGQEFYKGTYAVGKTQNRFALSLGIGINYQLTEYLIFNLIKYNFFKLGYVSTKINENNNSYHTKLKIHNFSSGMTIKF